MSAVEELDRRVKDLMHPDERDRCRATAERLEVALDMLVLLFKVLPGDLESVECRVDQFALGSMFHLARQMQEWRS